MKDYSTESERSTLSKLLHETFEWLTDNAERADEKVLRAKRSDLESLESPIIVRFTERQTRGKAIEDFQQVMFSARAFFIEAHKNNTSAKEGESTSDKPIAPPKYTDDELKMVEEMLKENEAWMDAKMAIQVKQEDDLTKDPVILTKDLNERGKRLQVTVGSQAEHRADRVGSALDK